MESLIGKRFNKYEIQAEIGRGGMGVVYLGYDITLKRTVAVKVLPPTFTFDQEFVERFLREAVLAANLYHPNIVTIHDVGEQEGYHYIVMEYLKGETLDQWLNRNGTMSPQQANRVLQQMASALDYAHAQGIVHRDVKPSNIMLAPDSQAKLMDFGLVRAGEGSALTRTGVILGTPEYMAPEQALGAAVDGRADIYALGVVLFRMLTGHVPFARSTPYAVTFAHIHEPPPPLRTLRPDLPAAMEAVVLKALAKNPDDRYQRASQLAQDFEASLAPSARPIGGAVAVGGAAAGSQADQDASRGPGKAPTRKTPPGQTPPPPARPGGKDRSPVPLLIGLIALLLVVIVAALLTLRPWPISRATPTPPVMASSPTTPPGAIALATPSPLPVNSPTQAPVATATPPPTRQSPTPRPSAMTVTRTPRPTFTPTARATATSTRPPTVTFTPTRVTATPTRPVTPSPTLPPPPPGVILDFEAFGTWRRGDQPYGTFTQTREQVHGGNYAAKLSYDIPNVQDSFVVFSRVPPAPVSGQPQALTIWVHGDGSNHFLNAWVQDSQNEVRQFTFGRIAHAGGWQPMTLLLDTTADWPQVHISGPDNGRLDYPIRLYAIVLDAVASERVTGVVYLDDLAVGEASDVAAPTARATSGAASSAPATSPQPASASLSGHIVYASGGNTIMVLDVATGKTWPIANNARQPDIHGDGLVVADGIGGGRDNLFVVTLNGSERVIGMHPEDSYPSWNPAGDGVAFHSTLQGDGKERIYIQWGTGHAQEPTMLVIGAAEVYGRNATWLANGRIAFSGCDYWQSGSLCGIWTLGANGVGPLRLTDRANDISCDSSGDQVLYSSSSTGNWEIHTIPAAGGAPRTLTNSPSQDAAATFSPNGQHIAFISDRDGGWGIWVMGADGSNPRKLLAVPVGFGSTWYNERLAWGP